MEGLKNLFQNISLDRKDDDYTIARLSENEVIGVYFSSENPDSKQFTKDLTKQYNELQGKGKKFEVVEVLSSNDEMEYSRKNKASTSNWLFLPFSSANIVSDLKSKLKIESLPSLVLIDQKANIISSAGLSILTSDFFVDSFPWKSTKNTHNKAKEILGDTFFSKEGDVSFDRLKGKSVGLYFSAGYCGPCKQFTPKLTQTYNSLLAEKKFEIIFVSADNSREEFDEYYAKMPWLAYPYELMDEKQALRNRFKVRGIPTFVMIDEDGEVINATSRKLIMNDPKGLNFPWYPKAFNNLIEDCGGLNTHPCLMILGESTNSDVIDEQINALAPVSTEMMMKSRKEKMEMPVRFFYCKEAAGPVRQIRNLIKVEANEHSTLVIVHLSDNGGYYLSDASEITSETISAFVQGFLNKTLERLQMVK